MSSIHLVTDLAFCTGLLLAVFPCYKFTKSFLNKKYNEIKSYIKNLENSKASAELILNAATIHSENVYEEIEIILKRAKQNYDRIMLNSKKHMKKMFRNSLLSSSKNIDKKLRNMSNQLLNDTLDIAENAARELLERVAEQSKKGKKNNDEVAASLLRDLNKKLH